MSLDGRNARLTVQLGLVLNAGNYEVVRPSVGLDVDVRPGEDVEDVYDQVMGELEWMLEETVEKLLEYTHVGSAKQEKKT